MKRETVCSRSRERFLKLERWFPEYEEATSYILKEYC